MNHDGDGQAGNRLRSFHRAERRLHDRERKAREAEALQRNLVCMRGEFYVIDQSMGFIVRVERS